ncbi:spore germination lipoprotein GerD [Peribacillus asahii]|uniref:spore germination lipoprotein GerD n=1 Tax=Peribacillus asahii TaxID=228899 RepID=UPI00207A7A7E|nr:spore germination lipoprotein GerD [Peribacillus asahii]USK70458.1 spore gernimation protein GerD [Peribacillus asahii]
MKNGVAFLLISLFIICTGCNQEGTNEKVDYEETKKMVVDILKTDDGKKALQEVLKDESMKNELIMNDDTVKTTIESTLTSDKGKEFWKKAFEDNEFTKAYAKALRSEHKKVLKELAKDPAYRTLIADTMKEPDIQKEITNILKGNEMRKIYKQLIVETGESPLVKAKVEEAIKKAATEAVEKQKKEEGGGGGEGEEGGGEGEGS